MITRPHLLHVVPRIEVSGIYSMAAELAQYIPQWQHTLLCPNVLSSMDTELTVHAQGVGLDVVETQQLTEQQLDELGATSAIVYDQRCPLVEEKLKSVYYSYGTYEPGRAATIWCSDEAGRADRHGIPHSAPGLIIPPMVNTRALRQLAGQSGPFTVAMITSGRYDKFPCELVMALMGGLKRNITLMTTVLPRYRHPGMALALDAERAHKVPRILCCPIHPAGGTSFTVRADVVVYGTASNYYEPYGRIVVEAMAMGKAVVVERKGVFGYTLEHGRNAMLYGTPEEAIEHIHRLEKDRDLRNQLGANAQLWASWQDISVHVGSLKEQLRA